MEFTAIDLRWGLTDEDTSHGRVIRTCLEEVDRCRPYFLALLGERYGWTPSLAEVQKDYKLLQDYPWIEDLAIDQASLVEMEITAGILNDPSKDSGSLVYARTPRIKKNPEEAKLATLRQKIEDSGKPILRYETVEELGAMVYRDLAALIKRDWPASNNDSPLDTERRLHELFAVSRRKSYIVNSEYHRVLQEYVAPTNDANNSSTPLVVHGVSGSGKSALMAYYSAHYRRTNPKAFVITHFVGASASGSNTQTILRHIIGDIRERYNISEAIPESTEQLSAVFPSWLARIQGEPLLLIIDAVNQLPEKDRLLHWLPEYLPSNVRIIVTTVPGHTSDAILDRSWQQLQIKPLDMAEREAMIVRFLGEYRKGLSQTQLRRVASDPKASSPLFLRTLLEELRLSGEHRLLEALIEHYMSARDIAELFQFVLERMENDYGRELVPSVMSLLASSRNGLSETEMMELTGATRVHLSILLLALDYHLMNPNGRYTFFHDYLRSAVSKRYLSNPSIDRARHRELAEYFSEQPLSRRTLDEEPWQWKEAGEPLQLVGFLSRIDVLRAYVSGNDNYGLLHHWLTAEKEFENAYDKELELLKNSNSAEYLPSMLAVAEFMQTAGKYHKARHLFEQILQNIKLQTDPIRLKALNAVGQILSEQGDYVESKKFLNEALEQSEQIYGPNSPKIVENLDSLATLHYALRNLDEAENLFRRALAISENAEGFLSSRQISLLSNIGAVQYQKGDLETAKSTLEKALVANERVNGMEHPETAITLSSLAVILVGLRKPEEAFPLIERASEINRRTLGPHHTQTLSTMLNLAVVASGLEKYEMAEQIFRKLLKEFSINQGPNSPLTLQVKNNLAVVLLAKSEFLEAEEILVEVLDALRTKYGENHRETIQGYLNLARVYGQAGKLSQAQELYNNNLLKYAEMVGKEHYSFISIEEHYRQLLLKIGEVKEEWYN